MAKHQKRWGDCKTIDEIRQWCKDNHKSGLALVWGQMLSDLDDWGDDFITVEDFLEEAEQQQAEGKVCDHG